MPDALDSVKALAADYRRFAREGEAKDPVRAAANIRRAESLETVAQELEGARKRLRPISADYGDLSDLPEEVMEQLNLSKVDELEQHLRDIVVSANGSEIGLDLIIIELYRRHKVTKKRTFIMNKLYRMGQKGAITSVEGKKGVYFVPVQWEPQKISFEDDLDGEIPF